MNCTGKHHGLDGAGGERGITITSAATTCFWKGWTASIPSTGSTSSTRRGTSISRSRSSARCACSTAVHGVRLGRRRRSRSPRRCGARRTSKVPRLAFVNKMDRVGAELLQAPYDQMPRAWGEPGAHPGADRCRGQVRGCRRPGEMKAITLGRRHAGHEVRDRRHPGRPRRHRNEWREKMVEAPPPRPTRRLMNKYLEDRATSPEGTSSAACACARSAARSCRCCAAPRSRTRASSDARRRHRLPAGADRHPPVKGELENGKEDRNRAADDEPFAGLAFKIMTDPYVGQLTVLPRLLGRHQFRATRSTTRSGPQGTSAASCRCTRTSARTSGGARWRHRRGGGPQGRPPATRCATRKGHHARSAWSSRAGDPRRRRAEDQGRPGEDGHRAGAWSPGAGGPVVPRPHRRESGQTIISGMGELHSRSSSTG